MEEVETVEENTETSPPKKSRTQRRSIIDLFTSRGRQTEKIDEQQDVMDWKQEKLEISQNLMPEKRKSTLSLPFASINFVASLRKSSKRSSLSTASSGTRNSSVFSVDIGVYNNLFNENMPIAHEEEERPTIIMKDSVDKSCLICASEDVSHETMVIPCSQKCNETYVHKVCIFEWKVKCDDGSGTCPLCRAKLDKIEYTPPDILKLSLIRTSFNFRNEFVMRPVPRSKGMLKAYVKVFYKASRLFNKLTYTYRYEFYFQAQNGSKFSSYPKGPLPNGFSPADGDILMLTGHRARVKHAKKRPVMPICTATDEDQAIGVDWHGKLKQSPIAFVQTNGFLNLQFYLLCRDFATTKFFPGSFVSFAQNRAGEHRGPRKIRVCLAQVALDPKPKDMHNMTGDMEERSSICSGDSLDEKGELSKTYELVKETKPLREILETTLEDKNHFVDDFDEKVLKNSKQPMGPFFAKNKEPVYMSAIGGYSLDFRGRVTLPSNKNFQLVKPSKGGPEKEEDLILQFGKVSQQPGCAIYTLDFRWPFTPVQAFAVALCSCDWKLGCG